MQLRARIPAPPLDAFVVKIWSFEGYAPAHGFERLMPDGSGQIVFNLAEDRSRVYDPGDHSRIQSLPGSIVAGPHSRFFVIDTIEQCSTIGVHFRPGGLFPFFGMPASELHDRHVALDALWGSFAGELRESLLEAPSVDARLLLVEQALLARASTSLLHPAVPFALGAFHRGPRTQTIAAVTGRIGLSARRFAQLFREQVGLTPKLYCRVQRFQRAVQQIAAGRRVEWTGVALDCGYFDQAHFINDFRAFSGLTPTAYAGLPLRHPNHVPLPD